MTQTTEDKALALVNDVLEERRIGGACNPINREFFVRDEVLCRAIEQRDAIQQEFDDYKQKVSNAVEKQARDVQIQCVCHRITKVSFNTLEQFIIPKPKPDPLVEVCNEVGLGHTDTGDMAEQIRAALAARGLKIVEVKNDV